MIVNIDSRENSSRKNKVPSKWTCASGCVAPEGISRLRNYVMTGTQIRFRKRCSLSSKVIC